MEAARRVSCVTSFSAVCLNRLTDHRHGQPSGNCAMLLIAQHACGSVSKGSPTQHAEARARSTLCFPPSLCPKFLRVQGLSGSHAWIVSSQASAIKQRTFKRDFETQRIQPTLTTVTAAQPRLSNRSTENSGAKMLSRMTPQEQDALTLSTTCTNT